MEEFVQRTCPICGEPRNEMRDGKNFILRCSCDWKRATLERLKKTVSQSFWRTEGKPIKKLSDWNPPIFRNDGKCRFQNLIEMQKIGTLKRMESFAFREVREGKSVRYAISESVDQRRNLFIRGPSGSGRGLLMATIKMLAAGKDISATPNPGEWISFKTDLLMTDSFKTGGEARLLISEQYVNVSLLTLENIRAEIEYSYESKEGFKKKWRGSTAADLVFIKRQESHSGSMIFTSFDFIKQIGDSFGDKLKEILLSPATSLILMFSKEEADYLLEGISSKKKFYTEKILAKIDASGSASIKERLAQKENIRNIEDAMYFCDAFPDIPLLGGYNNQGTVDGIAFAVKEWPESARDVYTRFKENKANNNMEYKEKSKMAHIAAVDECPQITSKMSDKEKLEAGKMMSAACSPPERIEKIKAEGAEILRRICPHD